MDSSRHGLFRYLTADETAGYLAIMVLFSATLLTYLSAVRYRNRPCRELSTVSETVSERYTATRLEEPADISGILAGSRPTSPRRRD